MGHPDPEPQTLRVPIGAVSPDQAAGRPLGRDLVRARKRRLLLTETGNCGASYAENIFGLGQKCWASFKAAAGG